MTTPFDAKIERAERRLQMERARLNALQVARDLFRANAERDDADAPVEADLRQL